MQRVHLVLTYFINFAESGIESGKSIKEVHVLFPANTLTRYVIFCQQLAIIGWPTFRIVYLYTLQYTIIDKTGLCLTVRLI